MSSSDAVLTTLLLKKGAVRLYSTLDSDVGKRVVITDKFNPLSVKEGTLDASLNLLYELPAFTTYNVKMYGLDGETVESDQNFKLDGYSYVEMNVGLNKNSFAGIKAIVDQGLESTMLQVGDEFTEADVGSEDCRWVVVAIDYNVEVEGYNHNVMIARKYLNDAQIAPQQQSCRGNFGANDPAWSYMNNTYYGSLSQSIKDSITPRKIRYFKPSNVNGQGQTSQILESKVWFPSCTEIKGALFTYGGGYLATTSPTELTIYPQMSGLITKLSKFKDSDMATRQTEGTRSIWAATNEPRGVTHCNESWGLNYTNNWDGVQSTASYLSMGVRMYRPCMMIASDPIE